MDERDVGGLRAEGLEREGQDRGQVALGGAEGDVAAGGVVDVGCALKGCGHDCDYTAEGWGLLDEREEVDDEAGARVE